MSLVDAEGKKLSEGDSFLTSAYIVLIMYIHVLEISDPGHRLGPTCGSDVGGSMTSSEGEVCLLVSPRISGLEVSRGIDTWPEQRSLGPNGER